MTYLGTVYVKKGVTKHLKFTGRERISEDLEQVKHTIHNSTATPSRSKELGPSGIHGVLDFFEHRIDDRMRKSRSNSTGEGT